MPSLSGDAATAYTVRVARAHQLKAGEATSYVVRVDKGSASWCAAVRYDALASFHAEAQALGAVNGVPFPGTALVGRAASAEGEAARLAALQKFLQSVADRARGSAEAEALVDRFLRGDDREALAAQLAASEARADAAEARLAAAGGCADAAKTREDLEAFRRDTRRELAALKRRMPPPSDGEDPPASIPEHHELEEAHAALCREFERAAVSRVRQEAKDALGRKTQQLLAAVKHQSVSHEREMERVQASCAQAVADATAHALKEVVKSEGLEQLARGALNAAQKRGDAAIKRLVLENAALRDELRQCSGDAAGERRDRAVNQLTSSDSSSSDADLPSKPAPGADDAHAQLCARIVETVVDAAADCAAGGGAAALRDLRNAEARERDLMQYVAELREALRAGGLAPPEPRAAALAAGEPPAARKSPGGGGRRLQAWKSRDSSDDTPEDADDERPPEAARRVAA